NAGAAIPQEGKAAAALAGDRPGHAASLLARQRRHAADRHAPRAMGRLDRARAADAVAVRPLAHGQTSATRSAIALPISVVEALPPKSGVRGPSRSTASIARMIASCAS